MSTAAVTNRRTGKVTTFQGEDFVLEFAGGRKIASSEFHVESVREQSLEGGKQLVLHLTHKDAAVQLDHRNESGPVVGAALAHGLRRPRTVGRRDLCALGLRSSARPFRARQYGSRSLGFPSGCGQPLYVDDLFLAIAHPGADNFTTAKGVSCRLAAYDEIAADAPVRSREFVLGAGEAGAARRALWGYLDATRPVSRTHDLSGQRLVLENKSRPLGGDAGFRAHQAGNGRAAGLLHPRRRMGLRLG